MNLKFIIDKKEDLRYAQGLEEERFILAQYELFLNDLKKTCREYQKSWDMINDEFFGFIVEKTGYKWAYREYICVVSVLYIGIANWGDSNQIIRQWKEDSFKQRRVTAHELIISHYFYIIKKYYAKEMLKAKQIWVLAEIAAFALTSLPEEVNSFWPWDDLGYDYNHNYPEIVPLQKKMKSVFLKSKDFDEYINTGLKLVKEDL